MQIENYEQILSELAKYPEITVLFDTDFETTDNTETMDVFLEIYDISDDDIKLYDGTYCEILFDGKLYEVHAGGNGDFSSHKIDIKLLN